MEITNSPTASNSRMKCKKNNLFTYFLFNIYFFFLLLLQIVLFYSVLWLYASLSLSLSSIYHATLLIFHYGGVSGIVLVPHFIIYTDRNDDKRRLRS